MTVTEGPIWSDPRSKRVIVDVTGLDVNISYVWITSDNLQSGSLLQVPWGESDWWFPGVVLPVHPYQTETTDEYRG